MPVNTIKTQQLKYSKALLSLLKSLIIRIYIFKCLILLKDLYSDVNLRSIIRLKNV
jgi:hypothetical protein